MFSRVEMIEFANMKVSDLKSELKKRGVKGYSKMKKAELQSTLLNIMEKERSQSTNEEVKQNNEEELIKENETLKNTVEELKDKVAELEYDLNVNDQYIEEVQPRLKACRHLWDDIDIVKDILRTSAKKYHPDMPNGDAQKFIKFDKFKNNLEKLKL